MSAMKAAIEIQGLVKRFGQTTALAGVDLAVSRGSVLGLLGPNGAGKTTTVRILATLVEPDAGSASVMGYDVVRQAHQVRQLIGLTGQYASVDEKLTGVDNLVLIGRLLGLGRRDARLRARELLADFQLEEAAARAVQTYSGGMRRRLDLAASLVGRPRILFLDEPTTGLDPRARLQLWGLIRTLVADGVTVLLTTQYLDEADSLADDIAVIDHGKVIAGGTPEELKARVGSRTLIVRPRYARDIQAAIGITADVTGAKPEVQGQRISVPMSDTQALPVIVRRLDQDHIAIDELALRGASLDDVFMSLTGHPAEADNQDDARESA